MNQENSSRYILALVPLLGGLVLFPMGLQLIHQWSDINFNTNLISLFTEVVKDVLINHTFLELIFNVIISFTVVKIIWRIIKQVYLHRKWNLFFQGKKHIVLSNQLNKKYRSWNTRFLVVRDSSFFALSMGLFHPRIVISTGLLNAVRGKEREAIFFHEKYHCEQYDPLKMVLVTLAMDGMSYIPAIKGAVSYYKIWKELLADRFAIKQMNSVLELGNALLKMISSGQDQRQSIGVHFTGTAMEYRIQQIIEPNQLIIVPSITCKSLLISIFVLMLMMFIVISGH